MVVKGTNRKTKIRSGDLFLGLLVGVVVPQKKTDFWSPFKPKPKQGTTQKDRPIHDNSFPHQSALQHEDHSALFSDTPPRDFDFQNARVCFVGILGLFDRRDASCTALFRMEKTGKATFQQIELLPSWSIVRFER